MPSPALQGQLLVWGVSFSPSPPISPSFSGGDTERRGGINAAVATDVNAIFKGKTVSAMFRTCTVYRKTFEGENFHEVCGFVAIRESFLHKLWGVASFGEAKACNPQMFSP